MRATTDATPAGATGGLTAGTLVAETLAAGALAVGVLPAGALVSGDAGETWPGLAGAGAGAGAASASSRLVVREARRWGAARSIVEPNLADSGWSLSCCGRGLDGARAPGVHARRSSA